jgi:putative flippase GtrA
MIGENMKTGDFLARLFRYLDIPPSVVLIGFANVVVFMAFFSLLRLFLASGFPLVVVLAVTYILSTSVAYLLNRKVVYPNKLSGRYSYLRFSAIYFSMLPVNFFFLELALRITSLSEVFLQLLWMPLAAGLRIVLVRLWVFRQ